jgi:hypothetical protein
MNEAIVTAMIMKQETENDIISIFCFLLNLGFFFFVFAVLLFFG